MPRESPINKGGPSAPLIYKLKLMRGKIVMLTIKQTQERFMNNRLIQKLKNEPYWTISDDRKRPLDAHSLKSAEWKLASMKNGHWPLISLSEINKDGRYEFTNRAYRLHAADNRVICIDM